MSSAFYRKNNVLFVNCFKYSTVLWSAGGLKSLSLYIYIYMYVQIVFFLHLQGMHNNLAITEMNRTAECLILIKICHFQIEEDRKISW